MADTGFTPIYLYYSSTTGHSPVAGNLGYGELAINITDGYLFYKDNANAIQKIGYKLVPTTAGGTGLTSFTSGGVVYASSTSALTTSSALLFDGTHLGINMSPIYALDVTDNGTGQQARLSSSNSNGCSMSFVSTSTNGRTWRIGGNYIIGNGEWSLYDSTASKEVLRADSSQNVTVVLGNLIAGTSGKGVTLKSPNGLVTKTVTIDNSGNLVLV